MSFVLAPLLVDAEIDNFEAFFITLIKLNSSSESCIQAKFPWDCVNKNSFFPDFAITDEGL